MCGVAPALRVGAPHRRCQPLSGWSRRAFLPLPGISARPSRLADPLWRTERLGRSSGDSYPVQARSLLAPGTTKGPEGPQVAQCPQLGNWGALSLKGNAGGLEPVFVGAEPPPLVLEALPPSFGWMALLPHLAVDEVDSKHEVAPLSRLRLYTHSNPSCQAHVQNP